MLLQAYSEARDLLEDAEDGRDTVYFESDLEEAREAVEQLLGDYDRLLGSLPDQESADLRKTALKFEEVRARLDNLLESLIHE